VCLLAVAIDSHSRYPVVIAGNRDEHFTRPTRPAHWWDDGGGIFGGRDLEAGGTWLALNHSGQYAVITNLPGAGTSTPAASRGMLVSDFLTGATQPESYVRRVAGDGPRYAGFNLVAGTPGETWAVSNADCRPCRLDSGISVVTNSLPDTEWPKARWLANAAKQSLAAHDEGGSGSDSPSQLVDALMASLARRSPVGRHGPNISDRVQNTPFVMLGEYGTRASTVLLIGEDGSITYQERSYDADGQLTGTIDERFRTGALFHSVPGTLTLQQ
jgi:uncharacterized protein with NRDE domain